MIRESKQCLVRNCEELGQPDPSHRFFCHSEDNTPSAALQDPPCGIRDAECRSYFTDSRLRGTAPILQLGQSIRKFAKQHSSSAFAIFSVGTDQAVPQSAAIPARDEGRRGTGEGDLRGQHQRAASLPAAEAGCINVSISAASE